MLFWILTIGQTLSNIRYYTHKDAVDCVNFLNGTKLDNRVIRTDLDPGFREGRQYGRGKSGGQVTTL
jgi:nuclear cap-binding protein subunit 2